MIARSGLEHNYFSFLCLFFPHIYSPSPPDTHPYQGDASSTFDLGEFFETLQSKQMNSFWQNLQKMLGMFPENRKQQRYLSRVWTIFKTAFHIFLPPPRGHAFSAFSHVARISLPRPPSLPPSRPRCSTSPRAGAVRGVWCRRHAQGCG